MQSERLEPLDVEHRGFAPVRFWEHRELLLQAHREQALEPLGAPPQVHPEREHLEQATLPLVQQVCREDALG